MNDVEYLELQARIDVDSKRVSKIYEAARAIKKPRRKKCDCHAGYVCERHRGEAPIKYGNIQKGTRT